jgi:hypothetical protein
MAKKETEYRRLLGRGRSGAFAMARVVSRLYMGRDYLLRVTTSGWVEKYRRFYYNDIKAMVVSRTNLWMIWNIVAAVLCAGFLFWCLSIHDQTGRITLGCLTLFFGVLLAVNAFLGPTCRVQIYTTLGSESLPSLGRLRTLRKAMEMLRPRLASAQGEVNAADIPQRLAEVASRPAIQYHTPERPRNNYSGAVHGWLFGMMLLNVVFIVFYVVAQGILPGVLVLFGTMALAGITVIALVKQHGSELGGALRTLAWVALGYVIACLVSGYVLMVYTVVLHPGISNDQAAIFKRMVAIPVMGTQWLLTVYCVFAGLALIVALTGLFLVMDSRRRAPAIRPTP